MTSRSWVTMLPVIVLSSALCVTGCRRQRAESPAEVARQDRAGKEAAELLARYFPKSPPKPAGLQLDTDLRILAPPGYFDRYELVDLAHERIPDDVPLYVRDERKGFAPVSRATAVKAPPGQDIYAYRRAPAVDRFEKDYGISVAVAHFSEEELRITGVGAEHTKDFDLIFGPRGMLPFLLNKNNLAPFDVTALTRFAPPRIFITEALGHLPDDTDLDFCIPYFRSPIGIGLNAQVVAGIPRTWAEGFESENNRLYWHRVLLRRDPFVLLSAAILYQRSLSPEKLKSAQLSTRQLLEEVTALGASSLSDENKAVAIQALRQKFAVAPPTGQPVAHNAFAMHTAAFTSEQNDTFAAEHYQNFEVEGGNDPHFESDAALLSAADWLKRLLVFGADFFDERTDQGRLANADWAYLIGTSARPFVQVADDPRFRFSLPAPRSPVELDVFVMPASREELNRQTAEFFVDYLLIPQIAASMTTFARRATLVRESVAFLPATITNSPIYSLPQRQNIIYLPILADGEDRLRRVWKDIVDFRDLVKDLDETNDAKRARLARRQ